MATVAPPAPEPPREVRGAFLSEAAPAQSGGLPTWLMAILFAVGLIGLIAGIYWLVGGSKSSTASSAGSAATAGSTAAAAPSSDPLTAAIEVSGIRIIEDEKHKGKVQARVLVVNHSSADLNGITVDVHCYAGPQKTAAAEVGEMRFTDNLAPYQSHEVTVTFNTKLKVYELPDWQMMSTGISVTPPK